MAQAVLLVDKLFSKKFGKGLDDCLRSTSTYFITEIYLRQPIGRNRNASIKADLPKSRKLPLNIQDQNFQILKHIAVHVYLLIQAKKLLFEQIQSRKTIPLQMFL
jgi:hypothetical protein